MLDQEQLTALMEICGCRPMGSNGTEYHAVSADVDDIIKLDQITSVLDCTSRSDTCHAGYMIAITPH